MSKKRETEESKDILIIKKEETGKDLFHLTCEVPEEIRSSYCRAGQYIRLYEKDKAIENSAYFALAGKVNDHHWEFLIKKKGSLSERLCSLEEGTILRSTMALGQGFLLEEKLNKITYKPSLYMFAMGSGLSTLRPLLLEFLFDPTQLFSGLHLWQGSASEIYLPFRKEYKVWKKEGIIIQLCLDVSSRSKKNKGNILEILKKKKPDLRRAIVCWGGSSEFGEYLGNVCSELGLDRNMFLSNL